MRWRVATRSYRRTAGDHRKAARPLRRYWGRASGRLCSTELHHHRGHDPQRKRKVFQLFLRARANNYLKARSGGRDTSVFRSIEDSLDGAKAEQAGLRSRIDDVLARAAITQGNNSDEYLTRDTEGSHYQSLLNTEITNGQRRLNGLGVTVGHFQFLKTALITRFPDFKALDTTVLARKKGD